MYADIRCTMCSIVTSIFASLFDFVYSEIHHIVCFFQIFKKLLEIVAR